MGVIQTDKWLRKEYDNPKEICKRLLAFFPEGTASELHHYLSMHGMYQEPVDERNLWLEEMEEKKVWNVVEKEKRTLQRLWKGPDIPIFILPADHLNKYLIREHNGKSGLAFYNKLFLFISNQNTVKEIRALFTHEYHHVCRLKKYKKSESNYTLLDTVILEGLAENAVSERFGEKAIAKWTSYYSTDQLKTIWERIILPNKNVTKWSKQYEKIMYGFGLYPKMAGYCAGYYIVSKYMKEHQKRVDQLFYESSETIAQIDAK